MTQVFRRDTAASQQLCRMPSLRVCHCRSSVIRRLFDRLSICLSRSTDTCSPAAATPAFFPAARAVGYGGRVTSSASTFIGNH